MAFMVYAMRMSTERTAGLVKVVRRSSMRSPDGFAEFVEARSPSLLRAAWLLTGDVGKAEDLLQTVLARAWRNWQRIRSDGNPEAYVRQMLYTTFLSWWRRRWRGEIPTEGMPDQPGMGDLAGESAVRDAMRRALNRLSPRQRAVLVLRFLEDLSVAETSALLGCTDGTVKTQTSRALAAMRLDEDVRSLFTEEVS
jgi:RNA polymerase sigma-70 factor (sigma-E family)